MHGRMYSGIIRSIQSKKNTFFLCPFSEVIAMVLLSKNEHMSRSRSKDEIVTSLICGRSILLLPNSKQVWFQISARKLTKLVDCFVDWIQESKLLSRSLNSDLLEGSVCLCLKLRLKIVHLQKVIALVARYEMSHNDL